MCFSSSAASCCTELVVVMADEGGPIARAPRELTAAIAAGRFDIDDVDLAMHITAGSMLGLMALPDARSALDADALADQYSIRVLHAFGLSDAAARELVARPLPGLAA